MPDTPEHRTRQNIDTMLIASGWVVQHKNAGNLSAQRGVAVEELSVKTGKPNYSLFVDAKSPGTLEAKPEGGPGKASQHFGDQLPSLLAELNEALAA